jgi:hypothetical protein
MQCFPSQIHDEVILEGPEATADAAFSLVQADMSRPFDMPLKVDLVVDAKVGRGALYRATSMKVSRVMRRLYCSVTLFLRVCVA